MNNTTNNTITQITSNQGRKNHIRPVVQIIGNIRPNSEGIENTAKKAIELTLNWLKIKQRVHVPAIAYQGESFEIDASENFPVSAIKYETYWSLQFDKFDRKVPGRIWRTEVTVVHSDEFVIGGVKLSILDSTQDLEFSPSIPAVIQQWIDNLTFYECNTRLTSTPVHAETDDAIDHLGDLLRDPNRNRPVLVFAGKAVEADAKLAAKRLAGLVHVYSISENKTNLITARFGKEFSLGNKTIRTYMPGFDPVTDEVNTHPFITKDRIKRIFGSSSNFIDILLKNFTSSTFKQHAYSIPSFREVKQEIISHQIAKLTTTNNSKSEREKLLEKENLLLKQKIQEKSDEFDYADSEEKAMRAERDIYKSQNIALKAFTQKFEKQIYSPTSTIDFPNNFNEIDKWVSETYPGRLILLNRAARAAKKSPYNNSELVYQCLDRLAYQYVDAKKNRDNISNIFDDLGVSLEKTGDPDHLKQWKDQYFVKYGGRTIFLEWHLKKGSDHNDTNTLRIYFFYDEEDEQIIVCHLTSHLINKMT